MDKRKYAKVNGWDLVKELGKQVDVSSQYVLPLHHTVCDIENSKTQETNYIIDLLVIWKLPYIAPSVM